MYMLLTPAKEESIFSFLSVLLTWCAAFPLLLVAKTRLAHAACRMGCRGVGSASRRNTAQLVVAEMCHKCEGQTKTPLPWCPAVHFYRTATAMIRSEGEHRCSQTQRRWAPGKRPSVKCDLEPGHAVVLYSDGAVVGCSYAPHRARRAALLRCGWLELVQRGPSCTGCREPVAGGTGLVEPLSRSPSVYYS